MALCECGCGLEVTPGSRFRPGHNLRVVNPMDNPDTIAKAAKSRKGKGCGDKNGMSNPEVAKKNADARRGPRPFQRGKNSPNYNHEIAKWIEENQGKHFCHCGCGGIIIIQSHHYKRGIPKYMSGHTPHTDEYCRKLSDSAKLHLKNPDNLARRTGAILRYYQNKRWNKEVGAFIDGDPITDFIARPLNSYGVDPEEFNIWRHSVYQRDNHTCQICGDSGCMVHAHHIIPQRANKDLILDVENGITLCRKCHRLTYHREELFVDELQMMVAGEI